MTSNSKTSQAVIIQYYSYKIIKELQYESQLLFFALFRLADNNDDSIAQPLPGGKSHLKQSNFQQTGE